MHKFRTCHAFVQRLKDVWKMGPWRIEDGEQWGTIGNGCMALWCLGEELRVIGKRGLCLNDGFRLRYFSLCAFDGVYSVFF